MWSDATAEPPPASADVVVIGGGVIGCAVCYYLAQRGAKPLLLEKVHIAGAATGQAGGFLALDWCDGEPLEQMARLSYAMHRDYANRVGPEQLQFRTMKAVEGREPGAPCDDACEQKGTEGVPSSKSHEGDAPEWLNKEKLCVKPIGTTATTSQLNVEKLCAQLLKDAVQLGATVRVGVGVDAIHCAPSVESSPPRVHAVLLSDGRVVECARVVVCCGPWTGKFLTKSFSQFRLAKGGVRGEAVHSMLLRPRCANNSGPTASTSWEHAAFLFTGDGKDPEIFPQPNGEVLACGMSSKGPTEELEEDAQRVVADAVACRELQKEVVKYAANLDNAEVLHEGRSYLPIPPDLRTPLIGKLPCVEGAYIASGHSCWGVLLSHATGLAMAELVADGHASCCDLSPMDPANFLEKDEKVPV